MSPVDDLTSPCGLAPAEIAIVLALADDELAMGHRHAEWIGIGPFLEEDLAFTSIAQDELGHARALLELLTSPPAGERAPAEPDVDAVDRLAYDRPPGRYRCAWLVEEPCPDWGDAFVRHLLYDLAETVRWEALAASTDTRVAALARRALAEEAFHVGHALPIARRLLVGTAESRRRMGASLDRLLPLAVGLFEPTPDEDDAVRSGFVPVPSGELHARWRSEVERLLADAGEHRTWPPMPGPGGRTGLRSAHFAAMHAEMVAVRALDPQATW
ncbi:MAG: 1,2-phenylacetyl-CoA epoxidase subunit PaaC [Actinomycetota bacterium]|nr:1,2-phenylacetyl-CoA epoxidase subunit PaaC [Actinomycetota bacterium]